MTNIETRYGRLSVPELEDDVIGRFLVRYGEWAWDEARFVASVLPERGARVLDLGAYVGTFGLGLTRHRDLGFLCAVEANAEILPFLSDNLERLGPGQACALGAVVARPGFELHPGKYVTGNAGSLSFAEGLDANHQVASSAPDRALTLSDLRMDFGPFDLVKIDVEGMELEILEGDAEFLARGETTLWVECNEDPRSLDVAELLLSWGLELYYFAFPAFNPDNHNGDAEPVFAWAFEAGLLAAPRSTPLLDEELSAHGCLLKRVETVKEVRDALWRTPRWGFRDWVHRSDAELVALVSHQLRGENYADFLGPGWEPGSLVSDRLNVLRAKVQSLQSDLSIQRSRAESAEHRLAQAAAQALDRLAELGAERELRLAADARAEAAETKAEVAEAAATAAKSGEATAKVAAERMVAIESSTTWRMTKPLRVALGAFPRLRKVVRRGSRFKRDQSV